MRFAPILVLVLAAVLSAGEHHGQVTFGGLPVPGATVTATKGDQKLIAITNDLGNYSFADLADGTWSFQVEMLLFETVHQDMEINAATPPADWELRLSALDQMVANTPAAAVQSPAFQHTGLDAGAAAEAAPQAVEQDEQITERAADGLLINGATNNAAASPFGQPQAFGNARRRRWPYNGNLGLIMGLSTFDARSYSLTGQDTPKPNYSRLQIVGNFGGALRIPGWHPASLPMFLVSFQWTRNRNANTQTALVPTALQRAASLGGMTARDPETGLPFPGNVIPEERISAQAKALLNLIPWPNFESTRYNYQVPVTNLTRQNRLDARLSKSVTRRDLLAGSFSYQGGHGENENLFHFVDQTADRGLNGNLTWRRTFTPRIRGGLTYQFSRQSNEATPFFSNVENISREAGITGNDQTPANWGPPSLNFSSGFAGLSDGQFQRTRNQTNFVSYSLTWNKPRHAMTFGGEVRRQQFNFFSQQNARGTFTFTGAATGNDFAGFLLGIPDTSAIAFGNADKYLRESSFAAYANDDWRVGPSLTINVGFRWEYWTPATELYGRLVNLDASTGFARAAAVTGTDRTGAVTGRVYPASLIEPDKKDLQPRIGIAWRPLPASSLIVRAGYGIYYDTGIYESIATRMSQQAPFSKNLSIANTPANPLTLARGFEAPPSAEVLPTFAADSRLRAGYAQNWQASVQRDLPAGLTMLASYLGTKGTHGQQQILPNTFPAGAANPCAGCPSGYTYLLAGGNSTRHAGQLQVRRRLRNGFTASVQYTFAKAIDNAALGGHNEGGALTAQNWLDLASERARSNFDQRHEVTAQAQVTTGVGLGGGTLIGGWKGTLFKDWTFVTQMTAGSGQPLSPVYPAAVRGTGVTGPLRPDYTGADLYDAPGGLALNPAAYTAPASGRWGNAGRNTITGPGQFSMNASMARTFRLDQRWTADFRIDATNVLNHVTYPRWITNIASAQFGLPANAGAMRNFQSTLRFRF